MTIQNAMASLAVADIEAATDWYSRLLAEPPLRPMPEVAEWHFGGGGGLQVYELPERAGNGSCTLSVSDIDDQAAALTRLGIGDVQVVSNESFRTLMITDPDGNHVAFAEAIDPS
jgi:catechol 2,3-dioxygenase-like lactoylglutathione lyase family enzyme